MTKHIIGTVPLLVLFFSQGLYASEYKPFLPHDYDRTPTEAIEAVSNTSNWGPLLLRMKELVNHRLTTTEIAQRLKSGGYDVVPDCTMENGCIFDSSGIDASNDVRSAPRNPYENERFACLEGACVSSACANPGTLYWTRKTPAILSGLLIGPPIRTIGYWNGFLWEHAEIKTSPWIQ